MRTGPALAELERLEDLPGDLDLLLGVERREGDADRVADAVGQQRAEADRALQRARPLRARLGHAEVQRVRDALGEQPVGGDRVRHRGGLHRHLEVVEVQALHELDRLHRGGDERLHRVGELELAQVLGQRAGVDADADRRAELLGLRDDLGDLLGAADVARVEPHAVRAGVQGLQRERVVEVDVGDDRDRRLAARSSSAPRRPARAGRRSARCRRPPRPRGGSAPSSPARFAVSVFVIVWTATGAPPPMSTPPTSICRSEAIGPPVYEPWKMPL